MTPWERRPYHEKMDLIRTWTLLGYIAILIGASLLATLGLYLIERGVR